jgi:hypothetical protein
VFSAPEKQNERNAVELFVGICVLIALVLVGLFFTRTGYVVLLGFFCYFVMEWDIPSVLLGEGGTPIEMTAAIALMLCCLGALILDIMMLMTARTRLEARHPEEKEEE